MIDGHTSFVFWKRPWTIFFSNTKGLWNFYEEMFSTKSFKNVVCDKETTSIFGRNPLWMSVLSNIEN